MSYDTIIKLPAPTSPPTAGVKSQYVLPRNYRHHMHVLNFLAGAAVGGAAKTDQADIIDTVGYILNAGDLRIPLTVAQYRKLQNSYENEKYAGIRPDTLIINWREWQQLRQEQQDDFSVSMGGVFEFIMEITFKPGLVNIRDNASRLYVDDGLVATPAGLVPKPIGGIRQYERATVPNSSADWFDWEVLKKSNGGIKRVTAEDAGKIDEMEVYVDKVKRWSLNRAAMKSLVLDVMSVPSGNIDLDNNFLIPFDYLNRATAGLGFDRPDGSKADITFKFKTNAAGGFPLILERFSNPTQN